MIKLPSCRSIGPGHPTYIIAEVGSNWHTLEDCLDSIVQAKNAGADAVKFQAFTSDALHGLESVSQLVDGELVLHYRKIENEVKWRIREDDRPVAYGYKLPIGWLHILKEKADACSIDFMCTAFSPDLYDAVNPFVDIHKVASAECTHIRILQKLRSFSKPVVLSTGAHNLGDVDIAVKILGDTPKVLLYCVASYPANEVNLSHMDALRTFSPLVGYSDHTTDVLCIPKLAAKEGACVIEKHFTAIPETETPDRPHSLDPSQFKRMVESIRGTYRMPFGASTVERGMLLRHNRRLIAIRDIKPGDQLVENENVGIYRSLKDDTHALPPFLIDYVNGKIAKRAIETGSGIGPGDV